MNISCPICESSDRKAVWDQGTYCMSRCRECGLYYQSVRLSEAELQARYQKEHRMKAAASCRNQRGRRGRRQTALMEPREGERVDCLKILGKIGKFKKKGELLEIGFGAGLLLVLAREKGWNVRGLDISEYAVARAKERHSLDVWCGRLEDSSFAERCFDVVILRQVLEHVYDLEPFLKKVRCILKDDGLLFVEIPNIAGLDYRVKGFLAALHLRSPVWKSMYLPEHLYYFSPVTLARLMEKHGFAVRAWETYSHFKSHGELDYRLASLRHVLKVGNKMRFFMTKKAASVEGMTATAATHTKWRKQNAAEACGSQTALP